MTEHTLDNHRRQLEARLEATLTRAQADNRPISLIAAGQSAGLISEYLSGYPDIQLQAFISVGAYLSVSERHQHISANLSVMAPAVLILAAVAGRVAPLWAMGRFPYLRADGTAGFHRRHARPAWDALPGLMALLGLAMAGVAPVSLLAGAPVAVLVAERLGRRLGGHTGDSYGASLVLTEAFTLLLMAVLQAPR